jgi:cell wall-associated NlpC family hydrolase
MTPDEPATRAAIVAEARSWRGTRYRHAGDIKHVGVDCSMLIVRVFVDLKLVPPFDPRPYSPTWMLHRNEEEYLKQVFPRAIRIAAADVGPGDLVLFKVGRTYSHGGIVTIAKPLTIVHAYKPAGRVVEDQVDRIAAMAARLSSAIYASYFEPKV